MTKSTAYRLRTWAVRLISLLALAGAGYGYYRYRQTTDTMALPTAPVTKGDFFVKIRCRGALAAPKSAGIYTPPVPGLRISWVAPAGEFVKQGDPIVRFDSSSAQQQLAQKESQLRQAQAALDQAVAQSKITQQQDQTELADATFSLERATVKVKRDELQSGRVKAEESEIDRGVTEQKLKVKEATVELHRASERSRLASLTRQRDQAQADAEITKTRIAQMELISPSNGLLTFRQNCSGVVTSTADCKPYKVGDNVSSGMVLGSIPDLESLVMDVKLQEVDRGRISVGQDVIIRVDAIPELTIQGKVTSASALAEMRMEYPYTKSFSATAAIAHPDRRLRPEMNGGMDIIVNRIPNAITIPSKALFTRAGKPTVYMEAQKGHYTAVEVEVLARNPDEMAVSGLPAGSKVTLVDVEKLGQKK